MILVKMASVTVFDLIKPLNIVFHRWIIRVKATKQKTIDTISDFYKWNILEKSSASRETIIYRWTQEGYEPVSTCIQLHQINYQARIIFVRQKNRINIILMYDLSWLFSGPFKLIQLIFTILGIAVALTAATTNNHQKI